MRLVPLATGSYLPEKILTNDDLAKRVDTNDEWIRARTGIAKRHIVARGETTSDLATHASRKALRRAGIDAKDLDLIIVATTTPDNTFPSTACKVQANLGNTHAAAFDIQAVCTGFVYALATANYFAQSGQYRHILIIGADSLSNLVDWTDRSTCILFGDGAGALALTAEKEETSRGVLSSHLYADGSTRDLLYVDGGPSLNKLAGHIHMQGQEVFKHAVVKLAQVTQEALEYNRLEADALDWVIPHQANQRILDATMRKLRLPQEKLISTVAEHANTSAASIPLALDAAVHDGRVQPGHLLALNAIGGGLTWGASLVRW